MKRIEHINQMLFDAILDADMNRNHFDFREISESIELNDGKIVFNTNGHSFEVIISQTDIPRTLYTVRKVGKDDIQYGSSHGSNDDNGHEFQTICEKEIGKNWIITHNDFDGEITCKKCLKILEKEMNNE